MRGSLHRTVAHDGKFAEPHDGSFRYVATEIPLLSQLRCGRLRSAVQRRYTLYHVHRRYLGSTCLTTRGSSTTTSRAYYAYGAERRATGDLQTDHTFTGQKRDATGLMYYGARYYDPMLGTFVSPDSIVTGAGQVISYNRFLYARGNPIKYTDPTGYSSEEECQCSTRECWEELFKWNNRCYLAHGYTRDGEHWSSPVPAQFLDRRILIDVLTEAGIEFEGS